MSDALDRSFITFSDNPLMSSRDEQLNQSYRLSGPASEESIPDTVSIVFVSYDWVMCAPLERTVAPYEAIELTSVPVIRIFGYLQKTGDQCTLVVHGFFPHFSVQRPRQFDKFVSALKRQERETVIYDLKSNHQTDIYGYHESPSDLITVSCVNPIEVANCASRVQDSFPDLRIYNVHIPYLLQFLVEYGIQGVSPIQIKSKEAVLMDSKPWRQTVSGYELHVHCNSIIRKQQEEPKHPVPEPLLKREKFLASPTAGTERVCGSALDAIWEEEFLRNPMFNLSGSSKEVENRPLAQDMPHVKEIMQDVDWVLDGLRKEQGISRVNGESSEFPNIPFIPPIELVESTDLGLITENPLVQDHSPLSQSEHIAFHFPSDITPTQIMRGNLPSGHQPPISQRTATATTLLQSNTQIISPPLDDLEPPQTPRIHRELSFDCLTPPPTQLQYQLPRMDSFDSAVDHVPEENHDSDHLQYTDEEQDIIRPETRMTQSDRRVSLPSQSGAVQPSQRPLFTPSQHFSLQLSDLDSACDYREPYWPSDKTLLTFPPPPKRSSNFHLSSQRWSLSGSLAQTQMTKDALPQAESREDVTYATLAAISVISEPSKKKTKNQILNTILRDGYPQRVNDDAFGDLPIEADDECGAIRSVVAILRDQRHSVTSSLSTQDSFVSAQLVDSPARETVIVFMVGSPSVHCGSFAGADEVYQLHTEAELLLAVEQRIFRAFDPAVLLSWDAHRDVLNAFYDRANLLSMQYSDLSKFNLSRTVPKSGSSATKSDGRIVLDLWKLLRSDDSLKLPTTSFGGCVDAVLGLTFPHIMPKQLCEWLESDFDRNRAVEYAIKKVKLILALMDTTCILDKAVEMARTYGCDITSVLSRGSQFRVECMLSRACKRVGFALVSSSKNQVKHQFGAEGIPMVLEPKSGFYPDPVAVLDFQSLYPSIVIAYNICYSTCLGKLSNFTDIKLGTQPFTRDLLKASKQPGGLIATPGNVLFVGKETRVGIVPRFLDEILQTRFMVKNAMKKAGSDRYLKRKLDARQLSLKLLANVTYGYTSASFSGRMPCAEIADAIVLTGRKTLEAAMVKAEELGGHVVYGDTDSLFVEYKGATLEEAFEKGNELAAAVTAMNPWPMKLQMEKIYWPCCLVTKKRYVGRAFESPTGQPKFDAKGIETVRRDTCPLTGKTLTKVLKAVFDNPQALHHELALHQAITKEVGRLLKSDGTSNIKDFVFQNTVKDDYKGILNLPAAARVAANFELDFSRGERVSYVVVRKGPDSRVADQVVPPDLVINGKYMIDIDYYINRQIVPAIQRTLGLSSSSAVTRWIRELPKSSKARSTATGQLDMFITRNPCLVCGSRATLPVGSRIFCQRCATTDEGACMFEVEKSRNDSESRLNALRRICLSCASDAETATACSQAWHCSTYFEREREAHKLTDLKDNLRSCHQVLKIDW